MHEMASSFCLALVASSLAWLLLTTPARASSEPASAAKCTITNDETLHACASRVEAYHALVFAADITSSAAACGPGGAAVIAVRDGADLTIDGKGHTWRRQSPLTCSAIAVTGTRGFVVRNLAIVENPQTPPCELNQKRCPSTVDIRGSANVALDCVRIYNGKGYVVRVWHSNGFTFSRDVIANAGEIGLYVGHWKYGASRDIVISGSVFAHARTNAVAVEGAEDVTIQDNVFNDNHWHGLWPVSGVAGGITSGGQLLLADATQAVIAHNIFANGACTNCVPRNQAVSTIELGGDAGDPGVHGLAIADNTVLNATGAAFYQNPGTLVSNVQVTGNRLRGTMALDNIRGAEHAGNTVDRPRTPEFGRTMSAALRIRIGTTLHTAATADAFPGGSVEAAFALSPAPVPGGPTAPILLCEGGTSDFPSIRVDCSGRGTPTALLGFAFSAATPGARPFFLCAAPSGPANRSLSWQRGCNGGTMVAVLGYARQGPR